MHTSPQGARPHICTRYSACTNRYTTIFSDVVVELPVWRDRTGRSTSKTGAVGGRDRGGTKARSVGTENERTLPSQLGRRRSRRASRVASC